jgi:hypothetical protein
MTEMLDRHSSQRLKYFLIAAVFAVLSEKIGLMFGPFSYPECRSGCPFHELALSALIDPVGLIYALLVAGGLYVVTLFWKTEKDHWVYVVIGITAGILSLLFYPSN